MISKVVTTPEERKKTYLMQQLISHILLSFTRCPQISFLLAFVALIVDLLIVALFVGFEEFEEVLRYSKKLVLWTPCMCNYEIQHNG